MYMYIVYVCTYGFFPFQFQFNTYVYFTECITVFITNISHFEMPLNHIILYYNTE